MLRTYKAILRSDHIEWIDTAPKSARATPVHITLLEEAAPAPRHERGRVMAEALAALADTGTFAEITDPVSWQREVRCDRTLPERDD